MGKQKTEIPNISHEPQTSPQRKTIQTTKTHAVNNETRSSPFSSPPPAAPILFPSIKCVQEVQPLFQAIPPFRFHFPPFLFFGFNHRAFFEVAINREDGKKTFLYFTPHPLTKVSMSIVKSLFIFAFVSGREERWGRTQRKNRVSRPLSPFLSLLRLVFNFF